MDAKGHGQGFKGREIDVLRYKRQFKDLKMAAKCLGRRFDRSET